jgi:hypothetical protein
VGLGDCQIPVLKGTERRKTRHRGTDKGSIGVLGVQEVSATGLIFEPSGATATPPNAPVAPPKTAPREAGVRTCDIGGRLKEETLVLKDAAFTSRGASTTGPAHPMRRRAGNAGTTSIRSPKSAPKQKIDSKHELSLRERIATDFDR